MFVLYFILGALAILATFIVLRAISVALAHFFMILPEYLWHSALILFFVLLVIGFFAFLLLLPDSWNFLLSLVASVFKSIMGV